MLGVGKFSYRGEWEVEKKDQNYITTREGGPEKLSKISRDIPRNQSPEKESVSQEIAQFAGPEAFWLKEPLGIQVRNQGSNSGENHHSGGEEKMS